MRLSTPVRLGPRMKGLAGHTPGLHTAGQLRVFSQDPQHPPLLIAQAMYSRSPGRVCSHDRLRVPAEAVVAGCDERRGWS